MQRLIGSCPPSSLKKNPLCLVAFTNQQLSVNPIVWLLSFIFYFYLFILRRGPGSNLDRVILLHFSFVWYIHFCNRAWYVRTWRMLICVKGRLLLLSCRLGAIPRLTRYVGYAGPSRPTSKLPRFAVKTSGILHDKPLLEQWLGTRLHQCGCHPKRKILFLDVGDVFVTL